jgi:hypothetical protein
LNEELEFLKRDLNRELAEFSSRLALAGSMDANEISNCGLGLEGWASRAGALGGAWPAEIACRARVIGEGISAGLALPNVTEKLMRLIIMASENLNQFAEDAEAVLSCGQGDWAANS